MKNQQLQFDYTFLLADVIGKKHGITNEQIESFEIQGKNYHENLLADNKSGKIGFYDLPLNNDLVKEIKDYVKNQKGKFENFVVLGIGGSALGNIALQSSLNHPYYNMLTKKQRKGYPRIFVIDNIDPELMVSFLEIISPSKTLFNVISKSGSTAETSAQFLIIADILQKKLGKKFVKNLVITTDKSEGDLRKTVNKYGIKSFVIPNNVGGRFSVLSSVGLLMAGFAGINISKLLNGSAAMLKRCSTPDIKKNPAYLIAIFHYLMDKEKKKNISVMMSYSSPLYYWADWYRQLWAESLGKNKDKSGNDILVGQTPVKALGVTDQHSQVQLYTEGPNDKVFTFLTVKKYRKEVTMPKFKMKLSSLEYLEGKKLSTLFNAEMNATEFALAERERPSCRIIFPEINEFSVGQFIMLYEIATAFAGELYNIDAFDQPGVEAGKKAAYGLLGRKGFEEEAKKIKAKEGTRFSI